MMNDEESIELLKQQTPADKPSDMDILGWTAERELLTTIVDVLAQIHATLIQVHSEGHKRPPVEPMRRPVTVLDKVEAKRAIEDHRELVRKLLPGR
jgi:hypothetical protein